MTRASDGAGGWTSTLGLVGTVEGSLQPGGAADTEEAGAQLAEARWQLFLDPGTDVVRDDVLQVVEVQRTDGWGSVDDGRTLTALSVGEFVDTVAGLDHMAVQLEEVQRGR